MTMALAYEDPRRARPAVAEDEIPILDLGPLRAGKVGALKRLGEQMRHACENVGFYFIINHGVSPAQIASVFDQAARFHALPSETKQTLKVNEHQIGYMPYKGYTSRSSRIHENTRPNLNAAYFLKRDLAPDHPDVIAGRRYRGMNQWPDATTLPGFRETIVDYCQAVEATALGLLPIYAKALDLPERFFEAMFREPQYSLRLTHYPPVSDDAIEDNQFALAPHTDSGFMTLLPQNEIPGLAIRLTTGEWVEPSPLPGSYLVNTGDMMRRWSNHRFLSTPHRVVHRENRDRYAAPFFFDVNIDTVMECLPSCVSETNPARHEPTTYTEYMLWFGSQYPNIKAKPGEKVATVE
jgi:isopenicillin N synthase-like dioxygenase